VLAEHGHHRERVEREALVAVCGGREPGVGDVALDTDVELLQRCESARGDDVLESLAYDTNRRVHGAR
jgi:hypothetical protein